MWILAKESLRYWVVQGATIVLSTIFVCYGIAVSLGHVPAWLPMISDCAVLPPEKYIFRLGMVIGSVFLAMDSILIYNADKSYSHSKLGLLLGMMGAVGMSIVGVVNEKENISVHSLAAVMMYLSYIIYMVVFSFYSGAEPNVSTISLIIKRVCAVLGVVIFTAFVFMSILYMYTTTDTTINFEQRQIVRKLYAWSMNRCKEKGKGLNCSINQ